MRFEILIMKFPRLIFSATILVFGFLLVVFSALKLSPGAVAVDVKGGSDVAEEAQGNPTSPVRQTQGSEGVSIEEIEIVELENGVDYYLPYPGILPDHPLYWLKMIRDRVRLWLTRNVEAKYERLLLYADKRIGAAKVLIEGGQADLGITTVTKAEKYLEQAVSQLEKVKETGKAYPERVENLQKAISKHEEVLRAVKEQVPDQAKPALDQAVEKAVSLQERLRNRFIQ